MNVQFLVAGALLLVGTGVHTIGGEMINVAQLKRTDLASNLKLELRMAWYLSAIDMGISGLYLLYLAFDEATAGAELLAGFSALRITLYGVMAFFLLWFTQRDHVFKTPQWILLLVIGLLIWWGML